jgi:hypothetical protein
MNPAFAVSSFRVDNCSHSQIPVEEGATGTYFFCPFLKNVVCEGSRRWLGPMTLINKT